MTRMTSPLFCPSTPLSSPQQRLSTKQRSLTFPACCAQFPRGGDSKKHSTPSHSLSRRSFVLTLASIVTCVTQTKSLNAAESITVTSQETETEGIKFNQIENTNIASENVEPPPQPQLQKTGSGISYLDFVKGDGKTPNWGDFVTFHYRTYTVSPSKQELVQYDTSYKTYKNGYIVHHGNGEAILGLEQMLHSMSVGSKRRFVLPNELAYFQAGFIPIPLNTLARRRFSKALSESNGIVVMDVEVLSIDKDQDDRGYYSDLTPTDEELFELYEKVRVKDEDIEPGAVNIKI